MRILLVRPWAAKGHGIHLLALPEPLNLETLAATVPEHEVRILDMRIDCDLESALRDFQPELVAVTALTPEVYAAQSILERAKSFSRETFTVAGGLHATLLSEDFFLPQVDAVALGESEIMFRALAQTVAEHHSLENVPNIVWQDRNGQFVRNRLWEGRIDLNVLPLPRRDLTKSYRHQYSFTFHQPCAAISTSRGCPFRCNFCSVHEFYRGAVNQASPPRVLAELAEIPIEEVAFMDDNFLMNCPRENAIADRIKAEGIHKRYAMQCRTDSIVRHPELVKKWVDIGMVGVLLGLEAGTNETLSNLRKSATIETNNQALKILHDYGVIVWGAFIVDPDWTADDFQRLHDYVRANKITHTQFTVLTPLPGTQLYRDRYHELLTKDYSCFDTLHAVLPTRLPREEFYQRFASLYRQTDIGPYLAFVREGKMTLQDCRRGKAFLDAAADWQQYVENDPILGVSRATRDPSDLSQGASIIRSQGCPPLVRVDR